MTSHVLLADGPSTSSSKTLSSAARCMNSTSALDDGTFLLFVAVEASLVLNDKKDKQDESNHDDKVEIIKATEDCDILDLRGKVRVQQQSTNTTTSNLFNIFESANESRRNVLLNMSSSFSSNKKKISSQLLIFEIPSKKNKHHGKLRPLCRVSMPWWLEAPDLMCIKRKAQFFDLAISSHSTTKMLCLRLECLNHNTIKKRRSCVVRLASNMRLKGMSCCSSSNLIRFLYTEHRKSNHTFHTTSVTPSKLILDLSRDLFRVCFPSQEKKEETIITKESEASTSKKDHDSLQNIILSTMQLHYSKLSERLESVESRCERMESVLERLLLLMNKN